MVGNSRCTSQRSLVEISSWTTLPYRCSFPLTEINSPFLVRRSDKSMDATTGPMQLLPS